MYTQTEKVNIEPKSYLPVFRISQNDIGRTLKAHLVSDEGTIAIPAGATVTMAGIKPSGLGYTVTGTINGSDVTFETNATMTDEAGQIESEIRIVDGETLIGTTNVVLNIEPNPHPDNVTDGQREPLVNEITALLNQITAQADRTEEYSSKVLNMTVSAHESQEPTVTKTEGEVVNLDFGLPRGEKGERGERGEQGEAGKDGKDGLDGKDGKDGKDGINGVTPDFSIGTVTTLEPTESASVTLTGTEEEPVLNFGIPKGAKGEQGEVSLSDLEKVMVTDTTSGAIASFPDGSDLLPAKSLVATIVPKQSGSGTPSPENVREISGWESVETSVCGKNLLNPDYNAWVAGGSYLHLNGVVPKGIDAHLTLIDKDTSVSLSGIYFGWVYDDVTSSQANYYKWCINNGSLKSNTTNLSDNIDAVHKLCQNLFIYPNTEESFEKLFARYDIQVELGTSATEYTPYIAPTTHTTSLGRTVYGGTVDVVRGTLTVTHGLVTLDGSDQTFSEVSQGSTADGTLYVAYIPRNALGSKEDGVALADSYEWQDKPLGSLHIGQFDTRGSYLRFVIADQSLDTLAKWEAYLAQNPLQLCYELATPTTYTLTPQTINTLAGVNNVWVDSGDCSITYYADTKLYIDKKLGGN